MALRPRPLRRKPKMATPQNPPEDVLFDSIGPEDDWANAIIARVLASMKLPHRLDPIPVPNTGGEAHKRYGQPRGDTINHRGLWRLDALAHAYEAGDDAQIRIFRELMCDHFALQRDGQGHCGAEELTTDHDQLHALIGSGALWFGMFYGDTALTEEAGQWWDIEMTQADFFNLDGHVFGPSGRGKFSTSDLRTANASILRKQQPPQHSLIHPQRPVMGPAFWSQNYNFSAWLLTKCQEKGFVVGRSPLRLRNEVHILTDGPNTVRWFPALDKAGPGVVWAAWRVNDEYGAIFDGGGVMNGRCPGGLPNLPNGHLTIVQGVS